MPTLLTHPELFADAPCIGRWVDHDPRGVAEPLVRLQQSIELTELDLQKGMTS